MSIYQIKLDDNAIIEQINGIVYYSQNDEETKGA